MELKEECDYTREAEAISKFRSHLSAPSDKRRFKVPWVWQSSTKDVLVMERLRGTGLGEASIRSLDQSVRNEVGRVHHVQNER
jgi:aarF domain-containing kinase